MNNFYYKTDLYRLNDRATRSLFRCYGTSWWANSRHTSWKFLPDLEEAFENLFSRILYLGPLREYPRRSLPLGGRPSKRHRAVWGKERFPRCFRAGFDAFLLMSRYLKWLQRLDLIDSYDVQPVSDTGGDYELLVKQHKERSPSSD